MTEWSDETLAARFEALHAERERTWDAAKLARNVAQRRALGEAFDPAAVAQPGDALPPFDLVDAAGGRVALDDLVAAGPVVLIFFRFAGCPACNIALPHYDRTLRPALDAAGVGLAAVSPHLPETGIGAIAERHRLGFPVLADRGNRLARRLGIAFAEGEVPAERPAGWIGELTGLGTSELPQPAVLILDRGRVVRFLDVSPDWLARTETPAIFAAVDRLGLRAAA